AAAGFTQVRTPNGVEGWVPTQYLTAQPIARERLAAANQRGQALEAQLKSLRETYQDVRGARSEVEGRATQLAQENQQLKTEIAKIRQVSATAIAQHEENQQLRSSNTSLQAQVDQLTGEVTQLRRNVQLRWLL